MSFILLVVDSCQLRSYSARLAINSIATRRRHVAIHCTARSLYHSRRGYRRLLRLLVNSHLFGAWSARTASTNCWRPRLGWSPQTVFDYGNWVRFSPESSMVETLKPSKSNPFGDDGFEDDFSSNRIVRPEEMWLIYFDEE